MKLIILIFTIISVSNAQSSTPLFKALNPVIGDVKFNFIGSCVSDVFSLTQASQFASIYNTKYFNPNKYTVMYFHGWNNSHTYDNALVEAYLRRGDHNIIAVNWSKFTLPTPSVSFPQTAENLPRIADFMANIMCQMRTCGFSLEKIHIVGFSLGAQLAGYLGRNFKNTRNFSFCRITGLDPTGGTYWNGVTATFLNLTFFEMTSLNSQDAKLVDIIHTDAGWSGTPLIKGHVDFWPNRGRRYQPACLTLGCLFGKDCTECSHRRALEYYIESVNNPNAFTVTCCLHSLKHYTNFTKENCITPTANKMGIVLWSNTFKCPAYPPIGGNFFLETKSSSPYTL